MASKCEVDMLSVQWRSVR